MDGRSGVILVVGDAGFQQKCLERVERFRKAGKTIVLVSHSTGTVQQMCSRVILVHKGEVLDNGPAGHVIARYQDLLSHQAGSTPS